MINTIKRFGLGTLGAIAIVLTFASPAHGYSNTRLMDDAVFDNVGSMNEQQIRTFINSRPSSCLATSGAIFPEPKDYFTYGPNTVDAARVIYLAAQYSDINPQVILATLQKEQTLITRVGCFEGTSTIDSRNKAMGQGCPDGGACPAPAYAGFHQQVMKGAWQLKFNKERAVGNVEWGANGSIVYPEPYTEGNRKNCSTCSLVYRDGYKSIDGQLIKLETGATASFYRYTPHLGQAFPGIFESWFGPTILPTYSSQYGGQSAYPTIAAGSTATVWFNYRNAGNQKWYDNSTAGAANANPVHLATTHPINRKSPFGSAWGGDQNRSAGLFATVFKSDGTEYAINPHIVLPGETARFSFTLSAPSTMAGGMYREFFQPIVEGQSDMNDPWTFMDIKVTPAVFTSAYVDQSPYPTLFAGQQTSSWFKYKNTGNQPWRDNTAAQNTNSLPLHLATAHGLNRRSAFGATWGGDQNRSAGLFTAVYEADGSTLTADQHTAYPGQIAKIDFTMKAPANMTPGTYQEFFQPIIEGGSVMNDPWTFLEVSVQAATYASQYIDQVGYPTISKGAQATVWFKYKNTGNQTWFDNIGAGPGVNPLHIATSHPMNRASVFGGTWGGDKNRSAGLFTTVYEADGVTLAANQRATLPGQIAKINFTLSASTNAASGVYREFFQPIIEGLTVMNDPWTFIDVTVQ